MEMSRKSKMVQLKMKRRTTKNSMLDSKMTKLKKKNSACCCHCLTRAIIYVDIIHERQKNEVLKVITTKLKQKVMKRNEKL